MKKIAMLLPFAALVATGAVYAEGGQALAEKHRCVSCHKVDQAAMGPSYRDIAKKYANTAAVKEELAGRVKGGSRGIWGRAPMAPQTNVPDEDLKVIIDYIMSLKR